MLQFAFINGHYPLYSVAVTLTNSQGIATTASMPQQITINSNTNISYYSSTINNVNWQDGNGNILYSWLESGETSTSTSSIYWVNLGSNTISGSSGTLTIYLVFYATIVNVFDGNYTGAEPNYTGTYGQYDNGVKVFSYYYNYSGSSTPSGMAVASDGDGGSVTFNNGASVHAINADGSNGEFLYVNTTLSPTSYILDALLTSASSDGHDKLIGWDTGIPTSQGGWWGWNNGVTAGIHNTNEVVTISADTSAATSGTTISPPLVISLQWESSSSVVGLYNYGNSVTRTTTIPSVTNSYPVLGFVSDGGTVGYRWGRIRIVPPSFSMPSTSAGILSGIMQPPTSFLPLFLPSWN